jgi:hypothetical protein
VRTYLTRIAAALNVGLLAAAVLLLKDADRIEGGHLIFAVLLVVTPAFTLFTLFAPRE